MFLDTNVLVRARFEAAPSHGVARRSAKTAQSEIQYLRPSL